MQDQKQQADTFNQTIERCAQAYHRVRAELPPKEIGFRADSLNQHKAYLAFSAEMPILRGPDSFQLYISCLARGAAIGAIDVVDLGRLSHLVQVAISVWKLANLTIPAAQTREEDMQLRAQERQRAAKERAEDRAQQKARQESEKQANPLPSKGNQTEESSKQVDVRIYPDWPKLQEYYQYLRDKGVPLIEDDYLARNPVAASLCCDVAEWALKRQQPSGAGEPAPVPKKDPAHAA